MGSRHTRLAAALAAAWESEVVSARTLAALADRTAEAHVKARLMVLAAFCRAHASRLLARLSSLGRGPLPVPPEDISVPSDFRAALLKEAHFAKASAHRYESMAELARREADLSSAWVCELNRSEEEDRGNELLKLAQHSPPDHVAGSSAHV
jgi:hypothetical protein